jgi:chemotaxis family two-component system response regulator PixG
MGVALIEILPLFQALLQRDLIEMRPYIAASQKVVPSVVCIDANLEVQASVKTALEPEGYRILALTEPNHVWSALMQYRPDMLLLDVDYFDGYRFVKALFRSERFKDMPVIALTERQRLINRWWAKRSGVTDCLVKPFQAQALSQLIQRVTVASA